MIQMMQLSNVLVQTSAHHTDDSRLCHSASACDSAPHVTRLYEGGGKANVRAGIILSLMIRNKTLKRGVSSRNVLFSSCSDMYVAVRCDERFITGARTLVSSCVVAWR